MYIETKYLYRNLSYFLRKLVKTKKIKYKSINDWWEGGKMYFKILAIEYSKNQNQNGKKTKKQNKTKKFFNKIKY